MFLQGSWNRPLIYIVYNIQGRERDVLVYAYINISFYSDETDETDITLMSSLLCRMFCIFTCQI